MPGTLYIVATPLGNLSDMTFRAVEILKSVDAVACEDTRHSRKLLEHFGIQKPLLSYHDHNEKDRSEEIVERVAAGESIAVISDAGTPLIADPGYRVVREACERGVPVSPIPGPSALVAALSVSGMPTDSFFFGGFLPRKATARRKLLESVRGLGTTLVFYEAPHRILESLDELVDALADPRVVLARELTKLHEEILRGKASELKAELAARRQILGEFTLVIEAPPEGQAAEPSAERVRQLEALGLSRMDAIKEVARESGRPKREIYRMLEESR